MKKLKKAHVATFLSVLALLFLSNCTRHDQVLNLVPGTLNTDTLYAIKGTASIQPIGGSAWDGSIESSWSSAPKLTVKGAVPDLGNGTFAGFIGNSTNITMRSMYDANNIYYLVEWDADQKNVESSQWYYNPSTKRWAQEGGAPSANSDGTYRPPFIQDQFVIMFNISQPTFNTLSCYAACHANSTYGGSATTGGVMYTNGPAERLDCWRARMLQVVNENQANDCFIDDGSSVGLDLGGTLNKNEVHGDWQVNNGNSSSVPPALQSSGIADGGYNNTQKLAMTGTSTKVSVPLWVKASGNYSNSAILIADTINCIKVTAVDSNGVLTLSNSTTIDPRTGTDYQQVGSGDGPKCIPGSIVATYTGSRGDVTANAYYTGTGWRLLLKRALKTSDAVNDVDLSSLNDQPFGVGVMFNGADNEHAIAAGLTLRFKK